MWGFRYPVTLARSPYKLSKPSRQCNRPPVPSHARVLKRAAGTLTILQTCCLREFSKVSRACLHPRGTRLAQTMAMIPQQCKNHRHTQSQRHTMHLGLPRAKYISEEVRFSSVDLDKRVISVLISHQPPPGIGQTSVLWPLASLSMRQQL